MNISQDGFFLPSSAPTSAASINAGLVQVQENFPTPNPNPNYPNNPATNSKRKRNLPGNPDPESEVVAMSPKSLMATNRFLCEICNKGFQRDQNLQLHRRGHNLPWKLKQKANKDQVKKKVYICPEKSCVHHDPSRALGDLTGIKKHFSRKHGEKKWKCDKCSKKYAVMSDWKAHSKICGTREYKCDCGTIFSRKDSFITHRAFCDALTEERIRVATDITASALNPSLRPDLINGSFMTNHQSTSSSIPLYLASHQRSGFLGFEASSSNHSNNNTMGGDNLVSKPRLPLWLDHNQVMSNQMNLASSSLGGPEFSSPNLNLFASSSSSSMQQGTILPKEEENMGSYQNQGLISLYSFPNSSSMGNMSATALLQKAAQIGSTQTDNNSSIFATALGVMRPSSSSTSSTLTNNLARSMNNVEFLQQKQLFRQQMNNQLSGLQTYSTRNEQLPMMGSTHRGDHSYNFDGSRPQGSHNNTSSNVGMRDFLGTLGGGQGNNNNNGGGEQERGVFLQEDIAYHQQEPYMDLMR